VSAELLLRCWDRSSHVADGIARLRQLVVDLAVRGHLLDHNARAERRDGALGPLAATYSSGDPLVEATVPTTWRWTNLVSVAHLENGDRSKNYPSKDHRVASGIPFVNAGHLQDDRVDTQDMDYISEDRFALLRSGKFVKDDLLFCLRGSLGKVARVSNLGRGAIASSLIIVRAGPSVQAPYLHLVLKSGLVRDQIRKFDNGTAQPNLAGKDLGRFSIALPPLGQQQRIVAKVDELMALCDELEAAQTEREARRDRLRATLLRNLVAPDEPKEHARFFLRQSTRVITKPEHVAGVREAILDLAVRGRLVAQDAEETVGSAASPPSRRRPPPREAELELPFAMPSNWRVVPVQALLDPAREISYGVIKLGTEPTSGGVPTLRCSDVKPRGLVLGNVRRVDETIEREYARTRLSGGEVVINVRGTLGGVAQIPPELKGYNVAREVAVIPIAGGVDGSYVVNAMASPYFWDCVQQSLRGIAYVGLNLKTLRALPIPLPPLAEQHRIVAKVDELMAVCDELEQSLATEQTERARLLEALLRAALEDPLPVQESEPVGSVMSV
jgi:type I restriction enzyme S subunit